MCTRSWLFLIGTLCVATAAAGAFPYANRSPEEPLERYAELARRDPYFALPGTDPFALAVAVEEFEITASLAIAPSIADHAEPYPFSFLKALAKAEGARQALINAPSTESALTYHDALTRAFVAYEADTERLIVYLRNSEGPERFGFLSGETSLAHVANVLAESLPQVRAYAKAEDARFACAQGSLAGCRARLPRARPERRVRSDQDAAVLPADGTLFRDALRAYDAGLYPGESVTIALSRSACYPNEGPMFYDLASTTSRLSGVSMVWMRPLHDLYFYDLARTDRPSLLELKSAGMAYDYQPFNAYLCPDFGIEMGAALTVLYAHRSLREQPLRSSDEALALVLHEQAAFVAQDIPTEATFARLAAEAEHVLSRHPRERLAASLGRDGLRMLEELVLLSRTKSGYFERVVGYFDDFQMGSAVFQAPPAGHIGEFLVARGGFSSLLLLSNRTAAFPEHVSLIETEAQNTRGMPEVISYDAQLNDIVPPSQLTELLQRNARIKRHAYSPRMEALIARRAQ